MSISATVRRLKRYRLLVGLMVAVYLTANAALVIAGLRDNVGSADVALVLGTKVAPDGTLSPALTARVDEALRLYRLGYFKLIVVSGAVGVERVDEAVAMKQYLVESGVPDEAVIADSSGINTFESARNLKALMSARHLSSVLVISQYFHVPRSRLALSKWGVQPVYWSHGRYFDPKDFLAVQREVFAFVRYAFREYR